MKRVLSLVLAAVMVISMFAGLQISSSAEDIPLEERKCGDNVYWSFDEFTGILTVSGEGDMYKFYQDSFLDGNKSIKEVVIESGVTSVAGGAFKDCTSLSNITFSDTVKTIGDRAFKNCIGLKSIYIPDSVESIDYSSFNGCSRIESIVVSSGNSVYDSRENCNAIIKTETNTLLCGCKNTVIPNTVTIIGFFAFLECDFLTTIEFPNSVTKIYPGAFYGCRGLASVTLPNSLTEIQMEAFENCRLMSVFLPSSVTFVGYAAFSACTSFKGFDFYYGGTEEQLHQIEDEGHNDILYRDDIHYNSSTPAGHVHNFSTEVTKEPSCTETGDEKFTCSCGYEFETSIPSLGHKFDIHKQYCLNGCGKVNPKYAPHVHSYKAVVTAPKANALGYTRYKCDCGEWKTDEAGKVIKDNFKAPTGKPSGFKCAARTAAAIKFAWNKTSGVNGYQIQLLNSAGKVAGTATTTGTAYTFSKLTAGSAYKARVRFYIKAEDGKNYYGQWATINSSTLPVATGITKVTPAKKSFTVLWKKAAVTGYQLQYATNNKFSGAKTIIIKKVSTLKYTVKNLASKKIYYVRIRTYKTIGGVNYYSAWSAVKSVKTK